MQTQMCERKKGGNGPADKTIVANDNGKIVGESAKSEIISIQLHQVRIETNLVDRLSQVFSWKLKAAPDAEEVVAKVVEDTRLPGGVCAETLELIWAGRQGGYGFGITPLKPIVGPPLQVCKDATHLLLEKRDLLFPAGMPCSSLGPLKSKLYLKSSVNIDT